jgi:hypothetical protein
LKIKSGIIQKNNQFNRFFNVFHVVQGFDATEVSKHANGLIDLGMATGLYSPLMSVFTSHYHFTVREKFSVPVPIVFLMGINFSVK